MTEQGEPGRTIVPAVRTVVGSQHPADHVLVQLNPEALGQLLSDLSTTQVGVASFEFDDRLDQILSGPFRAGFVPVAGGIKPFEFE